MKHEPLLVVLGWLCIQLPLKDNVNAGQRKFSSRCPAHNGPSSLTSTTARLREGNSSLRTLFPKWTYPWLGSRALLAVGQGLDSVSSSAKEMLPPARYPLRMVTSTVRQWLCERLRYVSRRFRFDNPSLVGSNLQALRGGILHPEASEPQALLPESHRLSEECPPLHQSHGDLFAPDGRETPAKAMGPEPFGATSAQAERDQWQTKLDKLHIQPIGTSSISRILLG